MTTTEHKQKFKHKYNKGDTVYFTYGCKVIKGTIDDIFCCPNAGMFSVAKPDDPIRYKLIKYTIAGTGQLIKEECCRATIEGLLVLSSQNKE